MAERDVVHTHLLKAGNVGQVFSNAIAILNTNEEGSFTLFFQTDKILLRDGDAAKIFVSFSLLTDTFDQSFHLLHSGLQGSVIPFPLTNEGRQEYAIEIALFHLG